MVSSDLGATLLQSVQSDSLVHRGFQNLVPDDFLRKSGLCLKMRNPGPDQETTADSMFVSPRSAQWSLRITEKDAEVDLMTPFGQFIDDGEITKEVFLQ